MQTAIPDFAQARVLVVGDGEVRRFGDALNGITCRTERPAHSRRAAHGA
jgi:hypothetical protein